MGGKRRAAAQEVAPAHAAGAVAQPGRGRFAWSELGQIDGARDGARKRKQRPDQQACENRCLHPQSSLGHFRGSGLNKGFVTGIPALLCVAQSRLKILELEVNLPNARMNFVDFAALMPQLALGPSS